MSSSESSDRDVSVQPNNPEHLRIHGTLAAYVALCYIACYNKYMNPGTN